MLRNTNACPEPDLFGGLSHLNKNSSFYWRMLRWKKILQFQRLLFAALKKAAGIEKNCSDGKSDWGEFTKILQQKAECLISKITFWQRETTYIEPIWRSQWNNYYKNLKISYQNSILSVITMTFHIYRLPCFRHPTLWPNLNRSFFLKE